MSLAALVSVPKLPPETLAWLASPDSSAAIDAGADVPGLDGFNGLAFISVFTNTTLGIAAVSFLHDLSLIHI